MAENKHFDAVIIGAGLAGLSLSRQLLMETDKTVFLLEKRADRSPPKAKIGESLSPVAGHYLKEVLDLRTYLDKHHLNKTTLRFYWKTTGYDNTGFEDYSQLFFWPFSGLESHQLERVTFEAELLKRNQRNDRFELATGVSHLDIVLADSAEIPHQIKFQQYGQTVTIEADWVIDTSGRKRLLVQQLGLDRPSPIHHHAFFWWVEGQVDISQLTRLSREQFRCRQGPETPNWLATSHFCDEGIWLWVIPLLNKTSLGLVFDDRILDFNQVFSIEKATRWVCEKFPLFADDLPQRQVLDFGRYKHYSYDCHQTLNASGWGIVGDAGRFADPLYSFGCDLIALHNTLIADAIATEDKSELHEKCLRYDQLMDQLYQTFVPAFSESYDALGDPEVFLFKYSWDISRHLIGYVFPFVNDLFTDRQFISIFLPIFQPLDDLDRNVQKFLSDYYQWKQKTQLTLKQPRAFDLISMQTLDLAKETLFEREVTAEKAGKILAQQVQNLQELARFLYAQVASVVLCDRTLRNNRQFIETINLDRFQFDLDTMRSQQTKASTCIETFNWSFDPQIVDPLVQSC